MNAHHFWSQEVCLNATAALPTDSQRQLHTLFYFGWETITFFVFRKWWLKCSSSKLSNQFSKIFWFPNVKLVSWYVSKDDNYSVMWNLPTFSLLLDVKAYFNNEYFAYACIFGHNISILMIAGAFTFIFYFYKHDTWTIHFYMHLYIFLPCDKVSKC